MAASASEKRFRPPFQLKIKTIQEKDRFFNSIFLPFIESVHPVESGLLDALYASSTLTDSEFESINEDTRTRSDKARKLYRILEKLPLNVLLTKVGPLLCSKFPHLIPVEFQGNLEEEIIVEDECDGLDQDCLRCGIQERIGPQIIADILFAHSCLSDTTYWEIQKGGCHHEGDWKRLFHAFRNVPDELNENLSKKMKSVLERHHFRIPENLNQTMASGFPCMCAGAENSIQKLLPEGKILEEEDMLSYFILSQHSPLILEDDEKRSLRRILGDEYMHSYFILSQHSRQLERMILEDDEKRSLRRMLEHLERASKEMFEDVNRPFREVRFFIYCNRDTMRNIERTGIVNDFTYSGESVILTTLSPTEGKEAIAKNMFGSNWRTKLKGGEVDYAICVQLPKDLLKNCSFGGRKLFKHRGALDLKNYEWKIVKVS